MFILLAGQGNMALAIEKECQTRGVEYLTLKEFTDQTDLPIDTVAIHVGSGRQLRTLIEVCERRQIPLIQGSTNVEIPTGHEVVIVDAPNLSLPMVRFMDAFHNFAQAMLPEMEELAMLESHQLGKKDTSGTARAIQQRLDLEGDIVSIRDSSIQQALGVPQEFLSGHAYHRFTFTSHAVEIAVTTKIHGRRTYAMGALTFAEALYENGSELRPNIYPLRELLHLLPE